MKIVRRVHKILSLFLLRLSVPRNVSTEIAILRIIKEYILHIAVRNDVIYKYQGDQSTFKLNNDKILLRDSHHIR